MKIDLEEALNQLDSMRELDSDEGVANALLKVAVAYLERGRAALATEPLDEAYYYCRKLDNDLGRAHVSLRQGQMELLLGRFPEAVAKYREALEVFESQEHPSGQVGAMEGLAQALAAAGDAAGAAASLEQALELAGQAGDKVALVLLRQYLAPLYRHLDMPEQALEVYLEMGRLAQELGDVQRVALALVGVASMQAVTGQTGAAQRNLAQAHRAYQELGQMARARQVEQEMARLRAAGEGQSSDNQEVSDD
ncbi:MAG: tetratricopeptide repeat protein [Desulfarculus sp.]|nr:tetratricopeptide repeat protein [Desulfarculus sp.]